MASATWDESVYNTPYFLIVYGTPYFFAMIFLELIYSIRTEKKLYRLSTGFTSFATGLIMSSLEKGIHGLAFIVPYSFVYHYCRIATLDHLVHPALLHFFAFLAHDLLYYVGHRFLHETNIGWAAHAPHHSSEK